MKRVPFRIEGPGRVVLRFPLMIAVLAASFIISDLIGLVAGVSALVFGCVVTFGVLNRLIGVRIVNDVLEIRGFAPSLRKVPLENIEAFDVKKAGMIANGQVLFTTIRLRSIVAPIHVWGITVEGERYFLSSKTRGDGDAFGPIAAQIRKRIHTEGLG